MTSREFCYWLQGYFEIDKVRNKPSYLDSDQVQMIQKHLNLVFTHEIDPSYPNKEVLDAIHNEPLKKPQFPSDDGENVLVRC